jgi:hypothetical protein
VAVDLVQGNSHVYCDMPPSVTSRFGSVCSNPMRKLEISYVRVRRFASFAISFTKVLLGQ